MEVMTNFKKILKQLGLPIAMLAGALAYYIFAALPLQAEVRDEGYAILSEYVQPTLIFLMLCLSFMKVKPREMRLRRWHLWVLLLQSGCFVVCSLLAMQCEHYGTKILCEGAMLAFVCPTATAAAVVTGKLGGSVSGVVTYLMLCNLMVSVLAPAFLPLVEPHAGMAFLSSFLMILKKVFPLMICPLVLAQLIRYFVPKLYRKVMRYPDLAFDLWLVALALAIMVTVRSIANTTVDWTYLVGLALVSGVACLLQFWMGKKIGTRYDKREEQETRITAGQAFGQKNTVFVIWMGLVFLDPVTSVVGGFYSVWHNLVNSWQLYKKQK